MACTGPSKEDAERRAMDAYKEIIELLKTKYHVQEPSGIFSHLFKEEAEEGLKKIEEGLKQVFWMDACDGF